MTTIITNHRPRPLLSAYDLSPRERKRNDIDDDSSQYFIRYRGEVYPLDDFTRITLRGEQGGPFACYDRDGSLSGWHGMLTDSFFSAIVIRLNDDCDEVVVGLLLS
jgi:hypothetical protein